MQMIREIRFINLDDEKTCDPDARESRWSRVFGKIEDILDDFNIMPEVATIIRSGVEMIISLDRPFSFNESIQVLERLEKIFKVSHFEYETECEDSDEYPHVSYAFYEK